MDDKDVKEVPPKKEKPVFPGFTASFKGHSQLPNEWLDEIISQIDSMAELKIVLYVYRHTWGFQEKKINPDDPAKHDKMKHITTEEFMHGRKKSDGVTRMDRGTGLSDWSVKDGIARALKHGYIICEIDARDKARVKKYYGLNFHVEDISLDERFPPTDSQDLDRREPLTDRREPPSITRIPPTEKEGTSDRSEKETSERNLEKNTKERKNGATSRRKGKTITQQESSHPSIQPSLSLSQNLSSSVFQEEAESEIVFSPEAERVYELAAKLHLEFLKKDEKHRDYCNKLVNAGVTTLEKLKSLMEFCWQKPYLVREDGSKKPLCLGNLATELDGWLQVQPTASPAKPRRTDDPLEKYKAAKERAEQSRIQEESQKTIVISSYDDDEYEDDSFYPAKVTESEMLEKIAYFSAHYGDDANIEANQRKAMELRSELGISLERFYDNLFHAQTRADHRGNTMSVFFEQLEQVVLEKMAERAAG